MLTIKNYYSSSSSDRRHQRLVDILRIFDLDKPNYLDGEDRPHRCNIITEKACRSAELSIFMLRDAILDEAVSLNDSLRLWNERWEKPILSWLEQGIFGK
jgi:hypothetical protein